MINLTHDYNELVPPSNPNYPWIPDNWQLLCYYCCQPIYETQPVAGYRQRVIYMSGRWHHKHSDEVNCDASKLRPDNEIDDPRCSCGSQTNEGHKPHCSIRGKPRYKATPMSQKEEELIKEFGWSPIKEDNND